MRIKWTANNGGQPEIIREDNNIPTNTEQE